jgi:RNA polymerase sigma factor (sigma-70 family)
LADDEIDERVSAHFSTLRREAARLGRRVRRAEPDELVAWGFIGLLDAARRFREDEGVPFEAFARKRIRGAMLDGLRQESPMPRDRPGHERRTPERDMRLADAREAGWIASLRAELRRVVTRALAQLPPTEAALTELHLMEDWSLREAAESLGLSRRRAGELLTRAMKRLAHHLRGRRPED